MKTLQLSIFGLILFFISCGKDGSVNCYKVTTVSSGCQGVVVQFSDEKVTDQNGSIVPNIIELLNVPQEFHEKGTSFYSKFIYDEESANKPVTCPAVYGTYKIYVNKGASKSSCEEL